MADTGWIIPANTVSEIIVATTENIPWADISGAFDDDFFTQAYAGSSAKTPLQTGEAFVMKQFGLGGLIPSGAVIDGIELYFYEDFVFDNRPHPYFEIICPGLNETDYATQPVTSYTCSTTAPSPYSTNYSDGTDISTPGGVKRKFIVGSSSSLWIPGVDYSSVTASGFGFAAVYQFPGNYPDNAEIYELKIRVHYTGGASDPMSVRDGGAWKAASPFVRDGGVWKPATPSIRNGGVWKAS